MGVKLYLAQLANAKPAGTTALLDAIQAALLNMRRAKYSRRAIIIISDGGDNHSRTTKTDILQMAREADAQMYTLGTYEPPAVRHRTPEEFTGPELLAGISEQTGAGVFRCGSHPTLPIPPSASDSNCATSM